MVISLADGSTPAATLGHALEIDLRLLTQRVVLRVPPTHAGLFEARFTTPSEQDAPLRGTWEYRIAEEGDRGLSLWEADDRFARAGDPATAADLLEARLVDRLLDYLSRWGWLVISGDLVAAGSRRVLTIGGEAGALTLLRDGEAVPLPLPLPYLGPLAGRGPLTDLVVLGAPAGPMAKPLALSALLTAVRAEQPGGAGRAVRQVTAALRDVQSSGQPDP
jgi:hypothetical protein